MLPLHVTRRSFEAEVEAGPAQCEIRWRPVCLRNPIERLEDAPYAARRATDTLDNYFTMRLRAFWHVL